MTWRMRSSGGAVGGRLTSREQVVMEGWTAYAVVMGLRPSCRSGFSLVELLVVLAIVVVLASLVLPVIQQVKQKARQMACLSNLRQLGCGLQGYAMENDGIYPLSDEMYGKDWLVWISPYVEADKDGTMNRGDARSRVLICPNFPAWGGSPYGANTGYAYNFYMNPRQSGITRAAMTVMVSERTGDNGFGAPKELDYSRHPAIGRRLDYIWPGDQFGQMATIPLRQQVGAVFADAHVQAINKAQAWSCMKWKVAGGDL